MGSDKRPNGVSGYEGLAIAVIDQARKDFYGLKANKGKNPADTVNLDTLSDRLQVVRRRIEAGRFLMDRTDPVVRIWFDWAGCQAEAFREKFIGAKERERLEELKAQEQALLQRIKHLLHLKLERRSLKLVKREQRPLLEAVPA